MSIPRISPAGRVAPSPADTPAPHPTTPRPAEAATSAAADKDPKQPTPPRFPWLSRLSQQLESASKRKPAFAPAPVLGDHVDKSV